jgi:ATP-dependent protease Clp ATPase subunit
MQLPHGNHHHLPATQVIELPLKHPELFESLGIAQPKVCACLQLHMCCTSMLTQESLSWCEQLRMGHYHSSVHAGKHSRQCLTTPHQVTSSCTRTAQGVLLYGPPGTGKTLLARAVAHHTDCTFIRVSGSELVQKYIGEGARMVRELFVMAREHAPSIIFMDEVGGDVCQCVSPLSWFTGGEGGGRLDCTLVMLK